MARTVTEIETQIMGSIAADANLSGLNSVSVTAIYKRIVKVVALVIYGVEVLFDALRSEVDAEIALLKPHRLVWYVEKAKAYQHGAALVSGADYYDNTALTEAQIVAQKIVAAAAATEQDGRLTMKVVKKVSGQLEPLSTVEREGFEAYMAEVKDAGVRISTLSFNPDRIRIEIDVYYDGTILSDTGSRLDGSAADPVGDALRAYISDAPFDSVFVKAHLVDALQQVQGVKVPEIRACEVARYDVLNWQSVDIKYAPYSGFLRIYDTGDLVINYIPYA